MSELIYCLHITELFRINHVAKREYETFAALWRFSMASMAILSEHFASDTVIISRDVYLGNLH